MLFSDALAQGKHFWEILLRLVKVCLRFCLKVDLVNRPTVINFSVTKLHLDYEFNCFLQFFMRLKIVLIAHIEETPYGA